MVIEGLNVASGSVVGVRFVVVVGRLVVEEIAGVNRIVVVTDRDVEIIIGLALVIVWGLGKTVDDCASLELVGFGEIMWLTEVVVGLTFVVVKDRIERRRLVQIRHQLETLGSSSPETPTSEAKL